MGTDNKIVCTMDRQLLSVYVDGELPSPWKEKLEAHIAVCSDCAICLEQYQKTSVLLAGTGIKETGAAQNRVWGRLHTVVPKRRPVWQRSVVVPIPALTAVAMLVILFIAFVVRQVTTIQPASPAQPNMALGGMVLDVESMISVSDRTGVFQYLEDQDTEDTVIIKLPENRNFSSYGEPTIIKAVDYPPKRKP
jgi:hypothetical protein